MTLKPRNDNRTAVSGSASTPRCDRILPGVLGIAVRTLTVFCLVGFLGPAVAFPSETPENRSESAEPDAAATDVPQAASEPGTNVLSDPTADLKRIVLEPAELVLAHPGATQRLVVTGYYSDGTSHDVSLFCRYVSSSPQVVSVSSDGVLRALAPGRAEVEAWLGEAHSGLQARVSDQATEVSINFSQDLLSIFTQRSCNTPTCHGAITGQAGFKLSLFGYDPQADYRMIVEADEGRRVDLEHPEKSLLLMKPTFSVPHGGGKRLTLDSAEYETIAGWLKQGGRYNSEGPRVTGIAIYPRERILLGLGTAQRWVVLGRLSDGTTRDMTGEVKYQVGDDKVVQVTPEGESKAVGRGQTHVMVRAMGRVAVARVGVVDEPPMADYPPLSAHNFVDEAMIRQWKELNLVPSEICSDEEFLRRVYLDVIGLLPTVEESERFLADNRAGKRAALIDELLDRDEYAIYWTTKLEDSFRVHQTNIPSRAQGLFKRFIRTFLREDRPYDEFVQEILTSTGDQTRNPAAMFWSPMSNTVLDITNVNQVTTTVSRLFLGIRMECVECHNHPLENLTQDDFFDLSAFFGQLRQKRGYETYRRVWWLDPKSHFVHPRTKKPLQPRIPFDPDFPVRANGDYRKDLAAWITSPENPFFARSIVNRIWREYFNLGIVEPYDDFRTTNPPSNEALLDGLARHLIDNGFRLKPVHRAILNSMTYQRTSSPNPLNKLDDPRLFTRYNIRILPAEAMLDALSQVTGVEHSFQVSPKGTRAQDVIYSDYAGYFLSIFGYPERLSLEERPKEPTLSQALHMRFGDTVMDKVQSDENMVAKLLESGKSDREIYDHVFMSAYSRRATDREWNLASNYLASMDSQGVEQKQILDDLLWTVINSQEFLVNH